ncbi:MAG: hemerythrin domain-containing protein [Bermanella sp.]
MSEQLNTKNVSTPQITVEALLEDDHHRIDQMYDDVLQAVLKEKPPMSQKLLFKLFKSGLLRHVHWEEKILFPLYEELRNEQMAAEEPASEAAGEEVVVDDMKHTQLLREQHAEIEQHLDDLESDLSDGMEASALQLLGELLKHHNDYEERTLYPAFEALNSAEMKEKLVVAISRGFK